MNQELTVLINKSIHLDIQGSEDKISRCKILYSVTDEPRTISINKSIHLDIQAINILI